MYEAKWVYHKNLKGLLVIYRSILSIFIFGGIFQKNVKIDQKLATLKILSDSPACLPKIKSLPLKKAKCCNNFVLHFFRSRYLTGPLLFH